MNEATIAVVPYIALKVEVGETDGRERPVNTFL
jgi:hypothetical protein